MTVYPTVDEVLTTHARLLKLFGGAPGLRDRGVLESALARPQIGYYRDVVEQAAALLESLWQNHPFIDGNKRTAVVVVAAFLRVNGYVLELNDMEAYSSLMGLVETDRFSFESLDPWLRAYAKQVPSS